MADTAQTTLTKHNETSEKANNAVFDNIFKAALLLSGFLLVCASLWLLITTGLNTHTIQLGVASFIIGCAVFFRKMTH